MLMSGPMKKLAQVRLRLPLSSRFLEKIDVPWSRVKDTFGRDVTAKLATVDRDFVKGF